MGRWKSKEERLRLAERIVHLRDVKKLQWNDIAEREGLYSGSNAVYHYNKYKILSEAAKEKMNFKQIEAFAIQYNIERGWVWLYESGFRYRVPFNVHQKIEDGKLGIGGGRRRTKLKVEKRDGRHNPPSENQQLK